MILQVLSVKKHMKLKGWSRPVKSTRPFKQTTVFEKGSNCLLMLKVLTVSFSPLRQDLGVSENSGFSPQMIHFNRIFHYFHHPFWGIPSLETPICSTGFTLDFDPLATSEALSISAGQFGFSLVVIFSALVLNGCVAMLLVFGKVLPILRKLLLELT